MLYCILMAAGLSRVLEDMFRVSMALGTKNTACQDIMDADEQLTEGRYIMSHCFSA